MNLAYFISSLNFGGAEKQTILDANLMVRENKVFLFYFIDGPQKEIVDNRVVLVKLTKKNYLITARNLAKIINQERIQIIHSSLFASMIISVVSSFFCKVNVVWHFHSHEFELPWSHKMAYMVLAHLPRLKKICFVNEELIYSYRERGFKFPKRKFRLLYNNATFHATKLKAKNDSNIVIGYIGRLVSLKRVEYLIDLAKYLINKQYSGFNILIVGDGDQYEFLVQETKKFNLENYITFAGFQNNVERYYNEFDIFINPSQEECLSIALIDAGISGIPSVAFDVGGNNEIIINAHTGYIVKSKEELFNRVLFLINNENICTEMATNAKEHCQKHFSEESHFEELKVLYKEVLV